MQSTYEADLRIRDRAYVSRLASITPYSSAFSLLLPGAPLFELP